jgi:hypothetical protein
MHMQGAGKDGKDGKGGASWRHSVYGAISGATARTCVAPFERLKILLEVSSSFPAPLPRSSSHFISLALLSCLASHLIHSIPTR